MIIGTWPPDGGSQVFIRAYEGETYEAVIHAFHRDAVLLMKQGYDPAGQHYVEGEWSSGRALLATVLLPFLVGWLLWAQMLVHRPVGSLTVTYVHRSEGE